MILWYCTCMITHKHKERKTQHIPTSRQAVFRVTSYSDFTHHNTQKVSSLVTISLIRLYTYIFLRSYISNLQGPFVSPKLFSEHHIYGKLYTHPYFPCWWGMKSTCAKQEEAANMQRLLCSCSTGTWDTIHFLPGYARLYPIV